MTTEQKSKLNRLIELVNELYSPGLKRYNLSIVYDYKCDYSNNKMFIHVHVYNKQVNLLSEGDTLILELQDDDEFANFEQKIIIEYIHEIIFKNIKNEIINLK